MNPDNQVLNLFLLALPIACASWTVTQEEVFRELREYCVKQSQNCKSRLIRKFFYLFTCEYCFSHYVAAFFIIITNYHLCFNDWRGYVIGGFALVWIANFYMSIFARLRVNTKREKMEADIKEAELKEVKEEAKAHH